MTGKLILRWDIQPETESDYFEFLVHELIPGMQKLGLSDIQVWYTAYGECEQKMTEGTAPSTEDAVRILRSDAWGELLQKLETYVNNYDQKVIEGTRGFQI